MIYIVALDVGLKCSRKIHLNTLALLPLLSSDGPVKEKMPQCKQSYSELIVGNHELPFGRDPQYFCCLHF